jgi:methionine-rich copper-binding protein CopC
MTISLATLLFVSAQMAFAHAVLVRSTPADHSVVHTRNVNLTLDYNSRIEARRCTVTLTESAGKNVPIQIQSSAKPFELQATANNLTNGTYHIHWQVLASDGHITRGEIAFTVDAN